MKHTTLIVIFALGIAALLGAGQQPGPAPAMGFEADLGIFAPAGGQVQLDGEVARSGKSSLRLGDRGVAQTGLLELSPPAWRLSFWMKTRDIVRGPEPWNRAVVQIRMFDADRKSRDHYDIVLKDGTTDWARHEHIIFFERKQNIHFVQIALMNWNATGTSWYDDIELVTSAIPEAYMKVPPIEVVENQAPRIWPLSPVRPLSAVRSPLPEPGTNLPMAVIRRRTDFPPDAGAITSERGVDIDRGYMTRYVTRQRPGPGPDQLASEEYLEVFRGSPIASWFTRLWLTNGASKPAARLHLQLAGKVDGVSYFNGNKLVSAPANQSLTLGKSTSKPFVILTNAADNAGVILYYPIPAEVRRWHVEDYIIEAEQPVTITLKHDSAGQSITYDLGPITTQPGGYCHSLDFYVFTMPFIGPFAAALRQFQLRDKPLTADAPPFSTSEPRGYWQPYLGGSDDGRIEKMGRYFPREFASWQNSSHWEYGHNGGHGWGEMTSAMNGIRVNGNAPTALARDHAWRMLTFFLEQGAETGAPPPQQTWREEAARHANPNDAYTVAFGQYWQHRLGEFRRWLLDSKLLEPAERERIYQELQRARNVFDPSHEATSWTYPTANGGYWFEYFNKPRGSRQWVINTHATSVINAGTFALLARDLQKTNDLVYWRNMFERGIDGLIYAWEQPDMWADFDTNEVRYARPPEAGPQDYHHWMISAWTPNVIRLTMEMNRDYRLADLARYWERMSRARITTDSDRGYMGPLLGQVKARLAKMP